MSKFAQTQVALEKFMEEESWENYDKLHKQLSKMNADETRVFGMGYFINNLNKTFSQLTTGEKIPGNPDQKPFIRLVDVTESYYPNDCECTRMTGEHREMERFFSLDWSNSDQTYFAAASAISLRLHPDCVKFLTTKLTFDPKDFLVQ